MWVTIILWLLSYVLSTKNGMSKGKAALLATGVSVAGSYLLGSDPSSGLFGDSANSAETTTGSAANNDAVKSGLGAVTSVLNNGVNQVGQTLQSWGPTGTVGVVAGTQAAGAIDWKKYAPWLLALGALFILK